MIRPADRLQPATINERWRQISPYRWATLDLGECRSQQPAEPSPSRKHDALPIGKSRKLAARFQHSQHRVKTFSLQRFWKCGPWQSAQNCIDLADPFFAAKSLDMSNAVTVNLNTGATIARPLGQFRRLLDRKELRFGLQTFKDPLGEYAGARTIFNDRACRRPIDA